MPVEPRGIYRERKGWGDQDSARVKYDEHQELDVPEDRYRDRGYQPPFDQLPWKDDWRGGGIAAATRKLDTVQHVAIQRASASWGRTPRVNRPVLPL